MKGEVSSMEKKLVVKMLKNCFKQYYETDSIPISAQDLEWLTNRILEWKKGEPAADLYEVINDVVYEFLTN
jgi:hypothetical protein